MRITRGRDDQALDFERDAGYPGAGDGGTLHFWGSRVSGSRGGGEVVATLGMGSLWFVSSKTIS